MAASNASNRKVNSAIRTGIIAALLFSAGLLAGVMMSARSSGPAASTGSVASVNGKQARAESTPTPAAYSGTVKQVLKDRLVVEAPKQKPEDPTMNVTVLFTDKTVIWANVPKTAAELTAGAPTELPPGSVPPGVQAVPPPASPDALKQPYKQVAISIGDFRVNDVIKFVTADNPAAMQEVTAIEVGWVATLVKPAGQGSLPTMSPDPGGRFGSAPPVTSGGTAVPEGSVNAPSAPPAAKPAPPPPPAPAEEPVVTPPSPPSP